MAEDDDLQEGGTGTQTRPATGPGPTTRAGGGRPEIVRRPPDIHAAGARRMDRGGGAEGKKLIVGREIALTGEINSCDKLVVEGHVEAAIKDCREIEIAETGTFKGEANIEVAEISGVFDGALTARELLVVRGTGRITGSVRFGQLEIERGGEIIGDIQVYTPGEPAELHTPAAAEGPAE